MKDQAFTLRKLLLNQNQQQLPSHCFAIMGNVAGLGFSLAQQLVNISKMHELTSALLYTHDEFLHQHKTDDASQVGFSQAMWLAYAQGRIEHLLAQHLKPQHLGVDFWFLQIPVAAWPIILRMDKRQDIIWLAEPNQSAMVSMIHGVNTSTGVDANIHHHVIVTQVNDHDEGQCVFNSLLHKFDKHCIRSVEYAGWFPIDEKSSKVTGANSGNLNWPEFTTSYCSRLLDKVFAQLPIAT